MRLSGLLGLLLLGMLPSNGGEVLHLKSGDLHTGLLRGGDSWRIPPPERRIESGRMRVIVQYASAPGEREAREVEALGGVILAPVPEDGWMVSMPEPAMESFTGTGVSFVGRLARTDKVSPLVGEAGWMVVEFFPDVTAGQAAAIVADAGLMEGVGLAAGERLVWGDGAEAAALAGWDEVAYVYPASVGVDGRACRSGVGASRFGRTGQYVASSAATWAAADGLGATVGYFLEMETSPVREADLRGAVEGALKEWGRYSGGLLFAEAASNMALRTMSVKFAVGEHGDGYAFDGPGGVLAHTFYPTPINAESRAGDVHLDVAETWSVADLYSVLLHEIGHGLGLVHSDDPGAVMYPMYRRVAGLGAKDIAAIRSMYGAKDVPEESDQSEVGIAVTSVLRNVATFPSGELVAIMGKAWGGTGFAVRWRYQSSKEWTAAPGAFDWMAPTVPVFGADVDVVVEVKDAQGRVAEQVIHIAAEGNGSGASVDEEDSRGW